MSASFAVILLAAGKSRRFQDPHYKKPFAPLAGKGVWLHSAEKFLNHPQVKQVILAIAPEDQEWFHSKYGANIAILGIDVTLGGEERYHSVEGALKQLKPEIDMVAIHDAARPCLAAEWINTIFSAAEKTGAAIPAIPVTSTLKQVDAQGIIKQTIPRDQLYLAQTPQTFRRDWLETAYEKRAELLAEVTDDAQLVEALGKTVTTVAGSPINLKITSKADLKLAEQALKALPKPKLSGSGNPFGNDDLWR